MSGLGTGLALQVLIPRLGPVRKLVLGWLLLIATYVPIFYGTPTTASRRFS